MKPIINLMLFAILVITACSSPTTFKEKKLVLKRNETARITEIDLSITNNGCGRKWVSEGDKPSFERPYCDLEIRHGQTTMRAGSDFKPVYIGNVEIVVEKMNPWGREEDSIPAGGCRVWVKLLEGR